MQQASHVLVMLLLKAVHVLELYGFSVKRKEVTRSIKSHITKETFAIYEYNHKV